MAVHVEHHGGVCTLTLDNPATRNALTGAMIASIVDQLEGAAASGVRVFVLRGANGTFCSGRDLSDIARHDGDADAAMAPLLRLEEAFRRCAVPIVAQVQGKAAGLGVSLVCWADMAVAASDASFSIPEARAGIAPSLTTVSLIQAVGRRNAARLCLTGLPVDASAAQQIGLILQHVGALELDALTNQLTDAVVRGAPQALCLARRLLNDAADVAASERIELAARTARQSFGSAELTEGIRAFKEKRAPSWVGG